MRVSRAVCVAAVVLISSPLVLAQAAQTQTSPPAAPPVFKVEVIATTPLPGVGLSLEEIPAPVQTLNGRDLDESGALDVADLLNRRLNGVHVNEIQGNPFQPDVSYRGYTASPLLGTPQGVSIYVDGVRLNQPFGDVVSWDLIPRLAISSTALMPGSNPLFGLNTLGGALSIQTKDGRSHPGTMVQATYGNHRRRMVEFEHGGSKVSGLNWYLTGNLFGERGWRDDSPSDVRQLFGALGWQNPKSEIKLTVSYANTELTGNGLQEQRFLDRDFASVYTKPDTTNNRATLVSVSARRSARNNLTFSGNAYYRHIRTDAFNGDINQDSLDQPVYQPGAVERAALAAAGYTGVPQSGATAANTPFPFWRCIASALLGDVPAEKCNGLLNTTETRQYNYGFSGQITQLSSPRGGRNLLTVGGAFDRSVVGFTQSTELGYLNPDRSVTGVGAFGDGVTGGTVGGEPFDTRVDLDGRIQTWSAYATDTLTMHDAWHVTLSARYNRTRTHNSDRIHPGGGDGSLDGDHVFGRLNPALGFTYSPARAVNVYAGYSEGSRAPTSIELGCADPVQPCKLPNAMAGDPPLNQVVTRTFEGGLRGGSAAATTWNVGVFRAQNRDDILFVASPQTGVGYFKNFGRTLRQGVEAGLQRRMKRVGVGAGYTFLAATFESAEAVDGSSNSTNDTAAGGSKGLEGTIEIRPADRIPLIPRHMLKAFADLEVTARLSLDLDLVAVSSSYARGNENNQHEPDGTYYLGPGTAPGYGVLNLGARYTVHRRLQIVAQINNLFDHRYYSAAQLGPAGFTAAGAFIARPLPAIDGKFPVVHATFYAPGAPITVWAGTRIRF
jgi:outer membrane receptor protein involved in Fe transport